VSGGDIPRQESIDPTHRVVSDTREGVSQVSLSG
jgi:hypothetical protein